MKLIRFIISRGTIDAIFVILFLIFTIIALFFDRCHGGIIYLAFGYATGVVVRTWTYHRIVNKYMTDETGRGLFGLKPKK